ncbi:MAG: hypothetical protein WA650_01640 [Bradyrhizobium sp.]
MKQIGLKRAFLIAAAFTCGLFGSLEWSQNDGLSVFATSAQARIGRPLTPMSGAGVARRTTRRVVRRGAVVGAVAVGAHCYHRVMVNGVWVCR